MEWGRQIKVEASILSKITAELPTLLVCPVTKWKHLSDLEFADPGYGTPARVDILLGGKVFSRQSCTPGGLIPLEHRQCPRCASVGY